MQYLDEKFKGVDNDFLDLKKDFNVLQNSVEAYAKKVNTYFQEMFMMNAGFKRHERWIKQIADKLDIKLKY